MSRQNLFLIIFALFYYLFFVNRGIVLYDEGYYTHIAQRILNGEVPYKDFFLQFTPFYFYLLAFFYKLFGVQVLVGKVLTLFICLGILFTVLKLLKKLKQDSFKTKTIATLALVSFGFPLINNPSILAWISVLFALLIVFFYTFLLQKKYRKSSQIALFLLGISLALSFLTKQNLGLYFLIATNIFLFFSLKSSIIQRIKRLLIVDITFFTITLVFFFYFFIFQSGFGKFVEFLNFNKGYLSIYTFSYPPLSFLLESTGLFKLLPYYLPVLFLPILLYSIVKKRKNLAILFFSSISLIGFFGTVYPTSDLLHVYPFYSIFLVSSFLFFEKDKPSKIWMIFIVISIGTGFYLTLFREYYRYQPSFIYQNTMLNLPKTKGIYIDKPLNDELTSIYSVLNKNTNKEDYILSYPFSPMLYFILERKNPSRFSTYFPGYLTNGQEREVIEDIKLKNVKYIITFLEYKFSTPLSRFIQSQKVILQKGQFKIFEIN